MYTYEGITFLKLERGELPLLWKLKQESWENTHQITINTQEEQENWFNSLDQHAHSPRNLVLMAHSETAANFGIFKVFGIDHTNRTADVGWDVFEEYRGQGLGKRLVKAGSAFCLQMLNLQRLTAEILRTNPASMACAEKAGFVVEGTKRSAVHKLGVYVDSHVLGLLASDFTT